MIGNLSGSALIFLADLERTRQDTEQAQRQISSGKRVESVADEPESVAGILQLRAGLGMATAAQRGLETTQTLVNGADDAVQAAVRLMDRAVVVAEQSGGSLQDATSRTAGAKEVQGLLEQMVALSRTEVAGRYVFSGDAYDQPSYALDPSSATGVVRLTQAFNSLQIADAEGPPFAYSKTAQDIFDRRNADGTPADDNVFGALSELRSALEQNDAARVQTSIAALKKAGDSLNVQSVFYGAVQNRIDNSIGISKKFQLQEQADLSRREDADLAALALQVSQGQVQQQASLAARAKTPQMSLFDYLG